MGWNKLTPGHNLMWESSRMMLPEHKMRIREHQRELTIRTKPVFDDQQIELFSQTIRDAIQRERHVHIQLFHPYHDQFVTGKIQKQLPRDKKLMIMSETETAWILLDDIIDIEML